MSVCSDCKTCCYRYMPAKPRSLRSLKENCIDLDISSAQGTLVLASGRFTKSLFATYLNWLTESGSSSCQRVIMKAHSKTLTITVMHSLDVFRCGLPFRFPRQYTVYN